MASEKIRIDQHGGLGLVWIGGWLFSIGYLDLGFWRGVLALLIWPYDLGVGLAVTPGGGAGG